MGSSRWSQLWGASGLVLVLLAAPLARAESAPLSQAAQSQGGVAEADGYRSELERAWFGAGTSLGQRAAAVRRRAVELGATNAEAAARALVAPAGGAGGLGEALLAVKLAPDLPLAHIELARVYWGDGDRSRALAEGVAAIRAIPRNLEASLWLASTLLTAATVVVVLASMLLIALAGVSVLPRAAHDLGDLVSKGTPAFARAGLLGAVMIAPLMIGEGMGGLLISLFALAVAYGTPRVRVAAVLASALLLLGLFPIARGTGRVLATLDADPVAAAADAIVRGVENDAEVALLLGVEAEDELAAHVLAVRARRLGRVDEAFARYQTLHERMPRDAIVSTNLANLHLRRGAVDEAIVLYERASQVLDSPVLWFNLSQAYARSFRMDEFENALRRAQELGSETVGELSQHEDTSLVADLPIAAATLRGRMHAAARGEDFAQWLRAPILPGRLGASAPVLALVFALAGALSVFAADRFEHASACGRCGRRICARCDGTVWNSVTCENCHRLFSQPETTDPVMRVARLGELRDRERRLERLIRVGSLLVPGVGGMAAGRPDRAFISILLFGWTVAALLWRNGVVPDPLVVGASGPLLLMATASLTGIGYVAIVVSNMSLRRQL